MFKRTLKKLDTVLKEASKALKTIPSVKPAFCLTCGTYF